MNRFDIGRSSCFYKRPTILSLGDFGEWIGRAGHQQAVFNTGSIPNSRTVVRCLKKNQNAPRPSEHPPVRGENCQNV